MLTARSMRMALAAAGVLSTLALTGANAASIPATSTPTASTGVVKVHDYCYKGYWYVHYCRKWGYDGYGNKYCRKWGHKRQGYCGGGGYSGGSY
jgi:hypothetical protein